MEPSSIQTGIMKTFTVVDFAVMGATLVVSLFIGIYFAIRDRNNTNPSVVLTGGGKMGVLPVAMSLSVTFLSALTILGAPAEVYNYNTMFWWILLALTIAVFLSAHVFVPFIYNLGITTMYEYLMMRFGKLMTVLAALNWMLQTVLYLSIVLYAPSLALQSVTGMDLWVSILTVGGLATVYTALGGMKAVLWTDSFQAFLIVVALLAVFIQGCIVIGGFSRAWEIADNNSRIYFHDFNPDPRERHSFWSVVVGGGVTWLICFSFHQSEVQRILSVPTVRKAKIALWVNLASIVGITLLGCLIGVLLTAFYADCHPKHFNNLITSTDQLLPLFVMDILGHLKGVPGLFLSCIFSGSLSSLSSGINALAAVTLQDYIRPFWPRPISGLAATVITKLAAAGFGLLCIGCAFVASNLGGVLETSYTVMSALDGPLFGVFLLGMFFPRANTRGTLVGYLSSLAFLTWIACGAHLNNVSTPVSSINIHGCNWNVTNTTMATLNATVIGSTGEKGYLSIYRISYLFYSSIGATITIIIGYTASFITGRGQPITTDPRLILPVVDVLFPCLPVSVRRVFSYKPVPQADEDGNAGNTAREEVELCKPCDIGYTYK